jgi:hypothetical protein
MLSVRWLYSGLVLPDSIMLKVVVSGIILLHIIQIKMIRGKGFIVDNYHEKSQNIKRIIQNHV